MAFTLRWGEIELNEYLISVEPMTGLTSAPKPKIESLNMPSVETRAYLPADPETVFDMLRKVEDFPTYTPTVESVTPLGEARYHWKTRIKGVAYEWDVEVVEEQRPNRLAWRSVSGIRNEGRYRLRPSAQGTELSLTIDYSMNSRLLDHTVGRVAAPIIRKISADVLARVRAILAEQGHS